MAIEFTKDQQSAIDAEGTVLVSAAAGSGKTAVLTERVVRLICNKELGVGADKLLIVTFTNLAASELRLRITKKMAEECAKHPGDEFYLKQKLLLQNAKICSIDSFCIELVRSNFSILGIEPDFSIADNSQAARISEQCLDNCLLKYYVSNDADFDRLGEVYQLDSGEANLKKAVLQIYDYCMTLPQPEKWLDAAVERYTEDGYSVYIKLFLDSVKNNINDLTAYISVAQREVLGVDIAPALLEHYAYIKDHFENSLPLFEQNSIALLVNYFSGFEYPKLTVRGCKEEESVKEQIKTFNGEIKKRTEAITGSLARYSDLSGEISAGRLLTAKLTELVKAYYHSYFKTMCDKKILTFSMVEHLALELLCVEEKGVLVPSKLSEDICKNYRYVLVDEYQDNNDLQDALFFAVSGGGKNLFMVGDVKQCIYGFRNANPENFLRYKDQYPEYKEGNERSKIVLKSNFRSRKGVCDFVNAFCNTVMLKEVSGMDYTSEDELYPEAKFPEIDTPSAELFLINNAGKQKNEMVEAEEVADYIEKTMKSGAIIRDKDGLRPAGYGDFVILLRSPSKRRGYYEAALKRRGIPVSGETDDFLSAPEVSSLISLLSVVNNPTRDIPLVALMTSPFFGFSYDELVKLRKVGCHGPLYGRVVAAAGAGDKKCADLVESISYLKTVSATKPLGRFIREVCDTYPLAAVYGRIRPIETVENYLSKFAYLAEQYDSSFDGGLDGFLDSLGKYSDDGKELAVSSDADCVKILSFHKSKGLQFPICIIAAAGSEFNQQDITARFVFCDKYGMGMKYISDGEMRSSLSRDMVAEYKKGQLIAEEIRIFYVAMTRAEDRLVIFGTSKSLERSISKAASKLMFSNIDTGKASVSSVLGAKSYLELLLFSILVQKSGIPVARYAGLSELSNFDTASFKVTISEPTFDIEETVMKERAADKESEIPVSHNAELREQLTERFGFSYAFEGECKIPSKMAVTELVHGDAESFAFTARPQFMSRSGLTPAQRGTAAHKFMQFADYDSAAADLEAELSRLREWEYLSEEEADSIDVSSVGKFFVSAVFDRIKKALKVLREYKFMVEYPYGGSSTIVQGIADCIFEEPDGLVILDFKTDAVKNAAELKERYRGQLEVYKYAVERIFGKPVKECILYSISRSDYISF